MLVRKGSPCCRGTKDCQLSAKGGTVLSSALQTLTALTDLDLRFARHMAAFALHALT